MRQFYRLHRRTLLAVATAVAVLVVLVTSVLAFTMRGGDRVTPGQPATAGPPTATPSPSTAEPEPSAGIGSGTPAVAGTWRRLPAPPVPASSSYAGVWTGADLLVFTPYVRPDEHNVLAAYRPASNAWRTLASSPYPAVIKEGGERVVWTGREMLAFGLVDAAYNPTTKQWRGVAAGAPGGASATVWTGRQVLMWGGGCCANFRADGASYDPATDVWAPIAAGPLAGRHAPGVWTGKELIVVGGYGEEKVFADGAAYNPATKGWRSLPSLPAPRTEASITWTGTEVLVIGGRNAIGTADTAYADGYAYNPATNRWRHLPSSGVPRSNHVAVWTGARLLVWGGYGVRRGPENAVPAHGMVYDPQTDRWSAMPASPLKGRTDAVAVWTGTEMLVFGGTVQSQYQYQTFTDGAAYKP